MYGTIFGDYVGSVYEFDNIKTKEFELFNPRASITDDSIMSIAVASACLNYAYHRDYDQFTNDVARELHRIGRLYPFPMGGYGSMFRNWLASRDPKPYGSWGNGSAMRVAPCAWVANSLLEAEQLGWHSALPTHDHPDAMIGAKAISGCIYLARTGKSKAHILDYLRQSFYPMDKTIDEIRPTYEFDGSCLGTAPVAVQAFLESTDFEDAIRNAVSLGGDCDTLTAITGSIAEAYYGMPTLHTKLTERALFEGLRDDEMEIVNDFRNEFCSIEKDYPCQRLTALLERINIDQESARTISRHINRPFHRMQMIQWLEAHPESSAEKVVKQSLMICRKSAE